MVIVPQKGQKGQKLEGLDVFEGDLGVDVVGGAHGEFDDDVGGVGFFVEPAFERAFVVAAAAFVVAAIAVAVPVVVFVVAALSVNDRP